MTARRSWSIVAGVVALALVALGLVLVLTGGDDAATPSTTTTRRAGGATPATLPLADTSRAAIQRLAGLVLPAGAADFLTAKLGDDTQLDVTFTLPAGAPDAFAPSSDPPPPKPGNPVIEHSSPLWKLTPEGTISGTADTHGDVARAVELVPEGDRLRVRVVITPAA